MAHASAHWADCSTAASWPRNSGNGWDQWRGSRRSARHGPAIRAAWRMDLKPRWQFRGPRGRARSSEASAVGNHRSCKTRLERDRPYAELAWPRDPWASARNPSLKQRRASRSRPMHAPGPSDHRPEWIRWYGNRSVELTPYKVRRQQ